MLPGAIEKASLKIGLRSGRNTGSNLVRVASLTLTGAPNASPENHEQQAKNRFKITSLVGAVNP